MNDTRTFGRPVTKGDVVKHAKYGCRACSGTGVVIRIERGEFKTVGPRGQEGTANEIRHADLCRCAQKRFRAKHPEVIKDEASGMHFWPAEEDTSNG